MAFAGRKQPMMQKSGMGPSPGFMNKIGQSFGGGQMSGGNDMVNMSNMMAQQRGESGMMAGLGNMFRPNIRPQEWQQYQSQMGGGQNQGPFMGADDSQDRINGGDNRAMVIASPETLERNRNMTPQQVWEMKQQAKQAWDQPPRYGSLREMMQQDYPDMPMPPPMMGGQFGPRMGPMAPQGGMMGRMGQAMAQARNRPPIPQMTGGPFNRRPQQPPQAMGPQMRRPMGMGNRGIGPSMM